MTLDVSVAVGTFGGQHWVDLAQRAIRSARALDVPVVHVHADSLHEARNEALNRVETEYVVHLDADDELDENFFCEMEYGTADVRGPAVTYINSGYSSKPLVPQVFGHSHACVGGCLLDGNWLVVGSLVRTELVRKVGGWRDYPVYEDFDLWQRCWLAGATFEAMPCAVYKAHVRHDSRNRGMHSQETKSMTHYRISSTNMPDRNWEYLKR